MPRLKPGDLVEFKVDGGLMYGQFTHQHTQYGSLLRLFGGRYRDRPEDPIECVRGEPIFSCFFPLGAAVKRGVVDLAGNAPIAEHLRVFPTFRTGEINPKTERVDAWWLWDGQREWRVGGLTEDQKKFPVRGVWNDTLLIDRLASGWRPSPDSII